MVRWECWAISATRVTHCGVWPRVWHSLATNCRPDIASVITTALELSLISFLLSFISLLLFELFLSLTGDSLECQNITTCLATLTLVHAFILLVSVDHCKDKDLKQTQDSIDELLLNCA